MKEIIFDNNGKEEKIYVESAAGYNDGYYWECSATVIYNDVEYSIQDAGSGSGWIPDYTSISVDGPRKLVSLMQLLEKEDINEEDDVDEWEYIEGVIICALTEFLDRGCKKVLKWQIMAPVYTSMVRRLRSPNKGSSLLYF